MGKHQQHDDGRADGIPAVTPEEWAARETARVERIGAMWHSAGNLVCGGRPMVSVRCRALGIVFPTVEGAARYFDVHPAAVQNAICKGTTLRGYVLERVSHTKRKSIGNDKSRSGRSLVKNRKFKG